MKKTLLSIFLIITLVFGSYRDARALIINPATLAAAGISILVVGGVYYYLTRPGTSSANNAFFSRSAQAAYIIPTAVGVYATVQKNLLAQLSSNQVLDAAFANPDKYPLLHAAALRSADAPAITEDTKVGDVVKGSDGKYYEISQVTGPYSALRCVSDGGSGSLANGGGYSFNYSSTVSPSYCGGSPVNTAYKVFYGSEVSKPPARTDLNKFTTDVAPSGSIGNAGYQDELDKMMQNPAYVPTFNDETGLPWAPPADVVTPANAAAGEAKAAAAAAAAAATASAQNAVAAATTAANAATAAAAANPNDPQAAAAAAAAGTALANAQAAADKAASEEAALNAEQAATEAEEENMPPDEPAPARKTFNFDKWRQLIGSMSNVWPFTLLLSLAGLFSQLIADPVAPAFDLPLMGNNLHIDLSFFDPIAMICRWVLALLLTIGAIQLVVKWYRGVS